MNFFEILTLLPFNLLFIVNVIVQKSFQKHILEKKIIIGEHTLKFKTNIAQDIWRNTLQNKLIVIYI